MLKRIDFPKISPLLSRANLTRRATTIVLRHNITSVAEDVWLIQFKELHNGSERITSGVRASAMRVQR